MIRHLHKATTSTILTIPVCFLFLYSFLFFSFQKIQKSLYFVSDDMVQILEFSETHKSLNTFFYHSPHVLVFNLSTTKLNEVFKDSEFIERIKNSPDMEITFSAPNLQDQFVDEIIKQNENKKDDKSHYKSLMAKMKTSSVKGKICFFKKCTEKFMAIKTRNRLNSEEEILAWR